MKSMHHLSKKNTFKFVVYNILFVITICVFTSCYGVKSQFAKDESGVFKGRSVCLLMRMDSERVRLFKQRFAETILLEDYNKCDYVVYAKLTEGLKRSVNAVSGIEIHKLNYLSLSYYIFNYDKTNEENREVVKDFIENPTLVTWDYYTGRKNSSLSKRTTETIKYRKLTKDITKLTQKDIQRLSQKLKLIDGGSLTQVVSNISNPLLLSSTTQAEIDSLEQLSVKLADILVDKLSFAIIEDDIRKEKKDLLKSNDNKDSEKQEEEYNKTMMEVEENNSLINNETYF